VLALNLILPYDANLAIGTGKFIYIKDANELVSVFVKTIALKKFFKRSSLEAVRIQYVAGL